MSDPRQVKIGGRSYEIQAFSPRKVFLASKLVKKLDTVARQVNKDAAGYRREYRQENAEVVTRSMAAMPPWSTILGDMTVEDWAKAGNQVEIRRDPSDEELMLVYLGGALEAAEDEVMRLIALVLIPNEELAEAKRSPEGIDPSLERYSERILDEGEGVGQLIDLADAVVETIREELAGKAPKIRNLRGLFRKDKPEATQETQTEETTGSQAPPEEPSEKKSSSSTPSPPATTGPTETASTGSPSKLPAA